MIIKNKPHVVEIRSTTEGIGGTDGIVLPLQVVASGAYHIAYTVQVDVGSSGQSLYLQVDSGSSDLWIASKACSSSPCRQTKGQLYDPSGSTPTGKDFTMNYLQGKVSGPAVWDRISVGKYTIEAQAFAAANSVASETLSPLYSGILGLALPPNSIIASLISPGTSDSPDGATWTSNIFSITPSSSAPSANFISMLLSRPGSDAIPAQLGIGRHPAYVEDPERVQYTALTENDASLFWKTAVKAITVWVEGKELSIPLGTSNTGASLPSAVLDSGVPVILTTRAIANGIYGAIGVNPSNDGQYHVPCTTPLNVSITMAGLSPIALHPLDLTSKPANDNRAETCIGLIQAADTVLAQPPAYADLILGVPFLRNTYSVMVYGSSDSTRPRLGLLGITNPVTALDEFNTVRVLNKPLSSNPNAGMGPETSLSNENAGSRLPKWAIALISILGFILLCGAVFGIRWWRDRRRARRPQITGIEGNTILATLGRATAFNGAYSYTKTPTDEHGVGTARVVGLAKDFRDSQGTVGDEIYGMSRAKDEREDGESRNQEEMGYRPRVGHKFTASDDVPLLDASKPGMVWLSDGRNSPQHRLIDEFGIPIVVQGNVERNARNAASHASIESIGSIPRAVDRWGDEEPTLVSKGARRS